MINKKNKKITTKPIALVTGGTRGIGRATVEQLLLDDFFVIINYLSDGKHVDDMKKHLSKISTHFFFIKANISEEKEVEEMFKTIKNKFKHIDVIVNNAGIINKNEETLEKISSETFSKMFKTNVFGSFFVTKKALPLLKNSSRGRIIFINSASSFVGSNREFGYVASKAANVGVVKALTLELSPWNICVNAVTPASIKTRMINVKGKDLERKLQKIPLRRLGEPNEVAFLVSFLASTKSSYITGQNIHINGGRYFS